MGGDLQISRVLSFRFAASIGKHFYNSHAQTDIYNASNGETIAENETAYIKGFMIGNTPQTVASTELSYRSLNRWTVSLTASHMRNNYIDISLTRRTNSVLYFLAQETYNYNQFVAQEKFDPATTLGLFVMKGFSTKAGYLYFIASVNNLLDREDIIYRGYEQSRINKYGRDVNATYKPFDSKYLYSYGRTFYLAVNYSF